MPEMSFRKRRPDKRKTYWSEGAAQIWIFCRDLVNLENSGALDEPLARRAHPQLRAIMDAALARARNAGGSIAPWAQAPEVNQMANARETLKPSKTGHSRGSFFAKLRQASWNFELGQS